MGVRSFFEDHIYPSTSDGIRIKRGGRNVCPRAAFNLDEWGWKLLAKLEIGNLCRGLESFGKRFFEQSGGRELDFDPRNFKLIEVIDPRQGWIVTGLTFFHLLSEAQRERILGYTARMPPLAF